jgi:signal transduction histidine kinase
VVRYVSYRRLHERMGQIERQAALDQERGRIARDMHDTLGASLTQMNILGALASREGAPLEEVRAHVGKMTGSSQALVQQLDEIVWAVDPENDTLDGLATYISQFASEFFADFPIRCRMRAPPLLPEVRLTTQVRHNLFLAVREALNNVARHSGATEVTVSLAAEDNTLTVSIEDNGHGFEVAAATQGHGLTNLKQRLSEVGGTCRIESRPGAGTKIALVWRWQDQVWRWQDQ